MTWRAVFIFASVGGALLLGSMRPPHAPSYVYNASDSAPRGWYRVIPSKRARNGDLVVSQLPAPIAALASARGYLPRSVPVLKRVAAVAGEWVCIRSGEVEIDGRVVASTLSFDSRGRPLAGWRHCRRLVTGELFLLNAAAPASFDSRYFGPIDVSFVRGIAVPTWGTASP